ncbi:MAG: PorP/SprF family type IX secretion system membrane protein [Bacteroidetes bacterium]|nr:PorP/SprF family type IX secretion system membrane protein [Bacteroidota bacterium]
MKTVIKASFCAFLFSIVCLFADAQDQNYTQYQNAPLYFNPALTGADPGIHTYSLGRLQWMSLPIPIKSFNFSGDFGQRMLPGLGGIGLIINGGKEGGLIDNLQAGVSLSGRIKLSSELYVQIGIIGSIIQRKVNWDDLVFASQLDPKYGNIYQSTFIPPDADKKTVGDLGAGFILQYVSKSGIFANTTGIAVDHIFEPNVSFLSSGSSPYPRKWVVHTDFRISTRECSTCALKLPGFADPLQIMPGIMYQYQSGYNTIRGGTDMIKFNFIFGLWFRYNITRPYPEEVFSIKAGYRISFSKESFIRFIYSIDLANKEFAGSKVQAHELSLTLYFGSIKKHKEE